MGMRRPLRRLALTAALLLLPAGGAVVLATTAYAGSLTATFSKDSDWGTGYQGKYTIANGTANSTSSWTVEFDLASGSSVGTYWDALLTTSGSHYTFKNREYNGTVAPNASATFGFVASGSGIPLNCKLNGNPCAGGGPSGSPSASRTTGAPDTTAPSVPGNLRTTAVAAHSVDLVWNASTDNVGVTGYDVFAGTAKVSTVDSPNATVGGLNASTSYTFTVKAHDAAGNASGASNAVTAKTLADTGGPSWHPPYLSLGTVYEPFDGSEQFWAKVTPRFPAGKHMDYGYLYLNGGSQMSEWHGRAQRLPTNAKAHGMTPIFVVYAIGGNTDNAQQVFANVQSTSYIGSVFTGLKDVGQTASAIMGSGQIGYVVEPDTLGYLLQNFAAQYNNDPTKMPAGTSGAYSSGALVHGVDPEFPNTLTGLVQAMNYALKKYTPHAFLGWQLNLWGAPGAGAKGIIHATEDLGFAAGKQKIVSNAQANANFAKAAGVGYQADFISIDKYGLDAACFEPGNAGNPQVMYWFWNSDLWHNYLLYAKTLKDTTSLPVVLWQIPVGHINSTAHASPTEYNPGGTFPDLPNQVQHCEDSASTFFFGDRFTTTSTRAAYFAQNQWADPKLSVSGNTVTWGAHWAEAAQAGIVAVLMGAGVGASTHGIPQPGVVPADQPGDNYYWITRVQEYYANPAPLP